MLNISGTDETLEAFNTMKLKVRFAAAVSEDDLIDLMAIPLFMGECTDNVMF